MTDRPLTVCHVIETLNRGGAEQLLVSLLPELQRQGLHVSVAVFNDPMDLAPDLDAAGIDVLQLDPRHRWNLVGRARQMAAVAKHLEADILHAHLYFPALSIALARFLRLTRVHTCVTFHNQAYAGANKAGPKLTGYRLISKTMLPRGIDWFFAVSKAVAVHYADALQLQHVDVLHNPVDAAGLAKRIQPLRPVTGSDCHIVLPGRLVHEKGHRDLIDALALLRAAGVTPRVSFAGDGPLRVDLETRIADADLTDQIAITGALPHDDLIALVATADLVCIPSRYEGFGLTALEAMALGRPVVASDAGGLPEVLGDAGHIVPRQNPQALAQAVQDLLNAPQARLTLGAAACTRARTLFDLPIIAKRLISHYQTLTGS